MYRTIKLGILVFGFGLCLGLTHLSFANIASNAPSYERDFVEALISDEHYEDTVFNINGISREHTIKENITCLFYPGAVGCGDANSGYLWNIMKYFAFGLIFVFIVYAAVNLVFRSDKADSLKIATNNLLYILMGSAIIFLTSWLLGDVLQFKNLQTTTGLVESLIKPDGVFFVILGFLKSLAFIVAVIMVMATGYRVMIANDGEKGKTLSKNILNIVIALVGIKVIDFVYLLASQHDFAKNAGDFIIQLMRFMGYISGIAIVIMVIVAGYLFIVDGGSGKRFNTAKGILINILIAMLALFFLLFLVYQIFAEFAG